MFRILIAEDDRELRQLFEHVLVKNGYAVDGVGNGYQALQALENSYFDLIISDIMMPEMDGYELVEALRQTGHQICVGGFSPARTITWSSRSTSTKWFCVSALCCVGRR